MSERTQTNCNFPIRDLVQYKEKVLNWLQQFSTFSFLDNHFYHSSGHSVECLAAAGVKRQYTSYPGEPALKGLQHFIDERKTWLFGHLAYDLKNEIEGLKSVHDDQILFPDILFYEPEVVIRFSQSELSITANDPELIFKQIEAEPLQQTRSSLGRLQISQRFTREEYIDIINTLKTHILRGDCYEVNFCQEFFSEEANINPADVYQKLSALSPNPFSLLYRAGDQWLICASPERFLKKSGQKIISQPIKGTARRVSNEAVEDEQARERLRDSSKDRSENVMVVDLVRNDLARVCREGTVKVDELFAVYSYPQVHQMISTISGEIEEGVPFTEILKATFPMGSMTGAPKRRVMELIEKYERTRRGIFSGAAGYISPEGDFDFNVVIRSIMYNSRNRYLSFQAGSGITFYSEAEEEWKECLLKAEAIKKVLGSHD